MGHLTNAKGFRAGKVIPWDYREHRYKGEGLKSFYFFQAVIENVKRKLKKYIKPLQFSFTVSHCRLKRSRKQFLVKLFVFNGQYDTYVRQLKDKIWGGKGRLYKYLKRKRSAKKRRNKFTFYHFWRRPLKTLKVSIRKGHLRRRPVPVVRRKRIKNSSLGRSDLALQRKFESRSTLKFWSHMRKWYRFALSHEDYAYASYFLSRRLTFDFRNFFLPDFYPFIVRFIHLNFNTMSAYSFADYVRRRSGLGYRVASIIKPLYVEARRSPDIKGLFFKLKGRYSRKPRSAINKKVFRYGKIAFSSVESKVDYSFIRFDSKFGTCSIKVWLSRFS